MKTMHASASGCVVAAVLVLPGCDAPKDKQPTTQTAPTKGVMTPERARELFDLGDYEGAEEAYTELLELSPDDPRLQEMLGAVRQNIAALVGQWRVSQQGFVRRAALNPTSTVLAKRMRATDPLVVECNDGRVEVRIVVTPHLQGVDTTTLTVELPAGAEPEDIEVAVNGSMGSYTLAPSRDWVLRFIAHSTDEMNVQLPTRDGVDEVVYELDGADQALPPLLACRGAKSAEDDAAPEAR
ncbi:MAG: tetratricopeptide repeat protein [Myxococcota bacterium]